MDYVISNRAKRLDPSRANYVDCACIRTSSYHLEMFVSSLHNSQTNTLDTLQREHRPCSSSKSRYNRRKEKTPWLSPKGERR